MLGREGCSGSLQTCSKNVELSISVVFYCGEIMQILLTFDYSYISDDKLVDYLG